MYCGEFFIPARRLPADRQLSKAWEVRVGIEPAMGVLQTPALPLGYRTRTTEYTHDITYILCFQDVIGS